MDYFKILISSYLSLTIMTQISNMLWSVIVALYSKMYDKTYVNILHGILAKNLKKWSNRVNAYETISFLKIVATISNENCGHDLERKLWMQPNRVNVINHSKNVDMGGTHFEKCEKKLTSFTIDAVLLIQPVEVYIYCWL